MLSQALQDVPRDEARALPSTKAETKVSYQGNSSGSSLTRPTSVLVSHSEEGASLDFLPEVKTGLIPSVELAHVRYESRNDK